MYNLTTIFRPLNLYNYINYGLRQYLRRELVEGYEEEYLLLPAELTKEAIDELPF